MLTILAAFSTGLSTVALVLSVCALVISKRKHAPTKRLADIDLAVADLEYRVEAVTRSHKRLNSRVSMRQARETERDQQAPNVSGTDQAPDETPEQWKHRMRKQLATGGLQHK